MDYDLLQQLEDAGYPIEFIYSKYALKVPNDKRTPLLVKENRKYGLREPSLSELIEACGYAFYKLVFYAQKTLSGSGEDKWVAQCWQTKQEGEGDTPEEAVAHLWLELHK